MKVILKESITGLGSPGDLVKVKSGYGRNFLMPTGKAIPATEENLKAYETEKAQLAELENKKIADAEEINSKLSEILFRAITMAPLLAGFLKFCSISG